MTVALSGHGAKPLSTPHVAATTSVATSPCTARAVASDAPRKRSAMNGVVICVTKNDFISETKASWIGAVSLHHASQGAVP